ncbi:hypothetical protein C1J03_11075 [Sulfitobacter sp. SK012]|nr:hypothetical protein C1J03_11075 [Sulfitobacter sp. SK012]
MLKLFNAVNLIRPVISALLIIGFLRVIYGGLVMFEIEPIAGKIRLLEPYLPGGWGPLLAA